MEFNEVLKGRRSIRQFTEEKVSHETIEKIVEAARFSPTWKNSQTVGYVVVEDRAILNKIADEGVMGHPNNAKIIRGAQQLVVVTSQKNICDYNPDGTFTTNKGNEWQMFDAGIAAHAFTLAAYDNGVSSVILGIFSDEKVAEIIGLDESKTVSTLIPIGYANGEPRPFKRKEVSEYLSFV